MNSHLHPMFRSILNAAARSLPIEWPELADRLYTRSEVQAMLNEAYAEGRADEAAEPCECQQIDEADRRSPV